MSVSTNAILFYGLCWDEEGEPEAICHPEDEDGMFLYDLGNEIGVDLDTHCSGDCPIGYVAVEASVITARRGFKKPVTSLAVDPDWDKLIADACTRAKIKPNGKPQWWLVSNWM